MGSNRGGTQLRLFFFRAATRSGSRRSPRAKWLVITVLSVMVTAVGANAQTAPGGTFWDDDATLHESSIEAIAGAGFTTGCSFPAVFFCPSQTVTRGQMASFLSRAFSLPVATTDFFTDDSGSHEADINRIAEAGITTGLGNGLYGPLELVSREQMASFLARAMGLAPVPGDRFVDVASIFEGDINAIADAGVTVGCDSSGSLYCPLDPIPREQMATFLVRGSGLAPIAVSPDALISVVSITDGDTFRASVNGISEPVRLIGIDTPEVGDCLSGEATAYLSMLISGGSVRLISDVSDRDQFDRLLRYVMVDGTFVNAALVRQGLASAIQFPPDTLMAPILEAAQGEAQAAGRGIWGAGGGCPLPPPPPPPPPSSNCHASYKGACLKVGQGDYDCAGGSGNGPNYIQGPVSVVGYDEFGLDADNDGVGCET